MILSKPNPNLLLKSILFSSDNSEDTSDIVAEPEGKYSVTKTEEFEGEEITYEISYASLFLATVEVKLLLLLKISAFNIILCETLIYLYIIYRHTGYTYIYIYIYVYILNASVVSDSLRPHGL